MNLSPTQACLTLTDLYQPSMAYAYWKNGRHLKQATFDLFFRRCPFKGEYAIAAGLTEALELIRDMHFTEDDIAYLQQQLPEAEPEFFEWLATIDASAIEVCAVLEGTPVFPRVPLMMLTGPLAILQLLETPLLNLINFSTLMATNAQRFRQTVSPDIQLLEFGVRRAQGPDGALRASRYSYLGGFDATSNVLAGSRYGMPVRGTHAHAYVQSFTSLDEVTDHGIIAADGTRREDFFELVLRYDQMLRDLGHAETNRGELAALITYAQARPKAFLALVDTYDTLRSGVPNFLAVAAALCDCGYVPVGIRLDSGDLAYFSKASKELFRRASRLLGIVALAGCKVTASNDINIEVLNDLKAQDHEIDIFGIGTNLVTCQDQPALGGVFKLVEIDGAWRIKLSAEPAKTTLPGSKHAYRLFGKDGLAIVDLIMGSGEPAPRAGERITCCHPSDQHKKIIAIPTRVEPLLVPAWDGTNILAPQTLAKHRGRVAQTLPTIRPDHLRNLNPTPYKVSVSEAYFKRTHELMDREMTQQVIE